MNDILKREDLKTLERVIFSVGDTAIVQTPGVTGRDNDLVRKEEIRDRLLKFNDAVQTKFGTKNHHGKVWDAFWKELKHIFVRQSVSDFIEATLRVDQLSEALFGNPDEPKNVKMKNPRPKEETRDTRYQSVQSAIKNLKNNLDAFWRDSIGGRSDSMPIEIQVQRKNKGKGDMGAYTMKVSVSKLMSQELPKSADRM